MKRYRFILAVIFAVALAISQVACGGSGGSPLSESHKTSDSLNLKKNPAMEKFLGKYPDAKVEWNADRDVPQSIRGFRIFVPGDSVNGALNFLAEIKDVFQLKDAVSEFSLRTVQKDEIGHEHVRFYQQYKGSRVVGAEIIVHINGQKQIYEVNGSYYPNIDISTVPIIGDKQALAIGVQEFQEKPGFKIEKEPELVIYPSGLRKYLLAYYYIIYYDDMAGDVGKWVYYVDATTGEIINKYNDIKYFAKPAEAPHIYEKGYTGRHAQTPTYRLSPIPAADFPSIAAPTTDGEHRNITGSILTGEGGGSVTTTGWYQNTNTDYYLYNKNRWWYIWNVATSGTWSDLNTYAYRTTNSWATTDRAEMSAAQNFHAIQNYFLAVHSRNSFDNLQTYARANVHQGTNYVNAYWDGTDFHFGDGDGVDANSLVTLDIAAHEYGHAWTEHTSSLVYQDESGALNESFSDIVGATVEFYLQPDGRSSYPNKVSGTADWLLGEDAWLSSTALRDMRNPSNTATVGAGGEQPSRYHGTYWHTAATDNGGVHVNSGVQNFVYYLLSDGGSGTNDGLSYNVTGIGIENARLVAYRVNSYKLISSDTHASARTAWISAANDLNPSWVNNVKAAWDAVGIIDVQSTVDESFEGDSLPSGWTTGGNVNWAITPTTYIHGLKSVKAGAITHSGTSYLQWTINIATPKFLSFFIKVSSESGWDYANFYIDGILNTKWSGVVPWTSYCVYLGSGQHTLKWEYKKDASDSYGSDTVWVDAVKLNPLIEAPSALSATAISLSQINLSWTDNSNNEAGFKIERKEGAAGTYAQIATVGANVTTYNDSGRSESTTYYYRVRAYNAGADSEYATEAYATTFPAAPSVLGGTAASATQINLYWTDNSTGEVGFKIERKEGAAGTYAQIATVGANVTTYNDSGRSASTTYYYQVRAYNAGGDSTNSNEAMVTTPSVGGGGGGGGGGGCFIATAAYGSYLAPEVQILRNFRDEYLMTNALGREFVAFYYQKSPLLANYISKYEVLRTLTRYSLTPIVYGIKISMGPIPSVSPYQ